MWASLDHLLPNRLRESVALRRNSAGESGRVSIICPSTDERIHFHPQLYHCFAAQRWHDKELVVIDTGRRPSPFLRRKMLEDQRVIYQHFEVSATEWSVGFKRNLANLLATGAIIAHFDDDDFYSPEYLDFMLEGLQNAAAVTLASWFVLDACTGYLARVTPKEDGSEDSWLLGYGFSYVYRRAAALAQPFPHVHFGEDFAFLSTLRNAGHGVRTIHDEEGHVLHLQQGLNLSHSHGQEVPLRRLWEMPVAKIPAFPPVRRMDFIASSFISVGSAHGLYLRPPPLLDLGSMRRALREMGVLGISESQLQGQEEPGDVLLSYRLRHRSELFVEPGRIFGAQRRWSSAVPLPQDVTKQSSGEQLALRHVMQQLLSRCPPRLSAFKEYEGFIRLEALFASHIALLATIWRMSCLFPRVRFEMCIHAEDPVYLSEMSAFKQRVASMQLLMQVISKP